MSLRTVRIFGTYILLCAAAPATLPAPQEHALRFFAHNQAPDQATPPEENPENQPKPEQPADKGEFFAGTITTIDKVHVTVSRTLVGKAPETRTFLINPETKVSKAVKERAKVTVRYRHGPDGDIALEIQTQPKTSKSSLSAVSCVYT